MITTHDIVLIHVDNKPGFYARVEEIEPDVKPGWWQVRLMVFTFPLQIFSWILDEFQLDCAPFTMGGTPIRMEKITSPPKQDTKSPDAERQDQDGKGDRERSGQQPGNSNVISLKDRRKR